MPQPTVVCCGGGGVGCGGGGCGGGCAGGGCCGRRKREAVQPLFKDRTVPCPQTEWREIIRQSILSSATVKERADTSPMKIQMALTDRFPHNKFFVICSPFEQDNKNPSESAVNDGHQMPIEAQLSSAGDGYCSVMQSLLWCHAVSMSA
ncbi:hypothetical protein niasHT_002784 [Heterodera trifolii]|uniref:Uncharacterized protein n=1 Tax=Heterodera trifolii TaxID=157864 RepID=A0ABD2M9G9_9BILA